MKSTNMLRLGLGFGFVGLLAPIASAQTYTEVLREGDPMPGVPGELVTRIDNVDINNGGEYLIELDTDGPTQSDWYVIDNNNTILLQQGSSTGISSPVGAIAGSFVDVVDINDNGDVMTVGPVTRLDSSSAYILIRNGVTVIEEDVTVCDAPGLPPGTVWTAISEVWQNNNNQLLVGGSVALAGTGSTSIIVRMDVDASQNIVSQTKVALDGETLIGPNHVTPIQGFSFSKGRNGINDVGDYWWYVDDEHSIAPGSTLSDSSIYLNNTIWWNEADLFPADPSQVFDHFSTAEIDVNNHGDWVFSGFDRNTDSAVDGWLFKSVGGVIEVIAHEGDPVPASYGYTAVNPGPIMQGYSYGSLVPFSDDADVLWFFDVSGEPSATDKALMFNDTMLMQEGITMVNGELVTTISDSDNEIAMSNDGQLGIFEVVLTPSIDAVFISQLVTEIGSPYCDPAVANSTGMPGVLGALGSTEAAFNNVTLQASGLPTGEFGFFLNGTGNSVIVGAGGSAGDLCVSTNIGRYNTGPQIFNSGATGTGSITLDLTNTPQAMGFTSVTAGETWYFQCWYRDTPGSTSNFTNGLEITFN